MNAQQQPKTNQANIGIKRIKELSFSIDENAGLSHDNSANVCFELVTNFNTDSNSVELVMSVIFINPDNNATVMQIKTRNEFFLNELPNYFQPDTKSFSIPDQLMITFISLSISHTRALLAKSASGSKYSELYLPIVNPTETFNHFFKPKDKEGC